jgi:diguanylate cyclase (GGDEF)-like protein
MTAIATSAGELTSRCHTLQAKWQEVQVNTGLEHFVEFAVVISSMTEFLAARGLAGLHQDAHRLEQAVLTLFEEWAAGLINPVQLAALQQKVEQFVQRTMAFVSACTTTPPARHGDTATGQGVENLLYQREMLLLTQRHDAWHDLIRQLRYFNVQARTISLHDVATISREVSIVMVDAGSIGGKLLTGAIHALRGRLAASYLIACEVEDDFGTQSRVLAAGCKHCFPCGTPHAALIDRIIRTAQPTEEEPYRVLVVEDSRTAAAIIVRTLSEGDMQTIVVHDPRMVLHTLAHHPVDLVLMDMHMPGCNGVEVTRVLRQHPAFVSTPVVYLSGDGDVSLQVDALRLGGDHFLTKPFNPVLLNAVITSKIERYRVLRRHMYCDSLTGLYNHSSCKQRLDAMTTGCRTGSSPPFSLAMVDIDHFKRVNDTWGHPAGDQVIRTMAWMLKQRLRRNDVVGRYGGEEFFVLLPHTVAADAQQLLEAIRRDFACVVHEAADAKRFQCSFSAGLTQWQEGDTPDDVLRRADEWLYMAKRNGRNQVWAAGA